jgi:hypothetical protein
VEAQISFEGIPLKGKRSKMAIILRAITVLDKGVHDVSMHDRLTVVTTNRFTRMQSKQGLKLELKNSSDQL